MTDQTSRIPEMPTSVELTAFWSDLSTESQTALLDGASLLEFEHYDRLDIDFGLILSGTAGIEYTVGGGRRCLVELFRAGDLVDLCRHERRQQGSLIGLGQGSVLALHAVEFETSAQVHPDIAEAYRHSIEDQLGRLRDHVNDLAVKTPLERIASVLFEFRRWPCENRGHPTDLVLPLLRKDIAAYAGMKPETVSRALRRLLEAGLIEAATTDREVITMLETPALRLIANGAAPRGS